MIDHSFFCFLELIRHSNLAVHKKRKGTALNVVSEGAHFVGYKKKENPDISGYKVSPASVVSDMADKGAAFDRCVAQSPPIRRSNVGFVRSSRQNFSLAKS